MERKPKPTLFGLHFIFLVLTLGKLVQLCVTF